jgi:hypothetical protein
MKTILLLSLSVILGHSMLAADEQTAVMLERGKDYALRFVENAHLSAVGPVRVLSEVQNGWVRIEYAPGSPVARPGATSEKAPIKKQVWLNLAHVVTIQDWEAATRDAEQRAAENAERRSAREVKPAGQ